MYTCRGSLDRIIVILLTFLLGKVMVIVLTLVPLAEWSNLAYLGSLGKVMVTVLVLTSSRKQW